nr:histidine phosphatase family protein [Marivita sp. S6314]
MILMRHAKSDWSAGEDDHGRPLNKRGTQSAPAMGEWLRAQGWIPQEALCSTATRTRQTLDLLGFDGLPTRFERGLYLADARDMIACLQTASADTVLMVGHNHGIADCAHQLVADWPANPRFMDYPTCATALITFAVDSWGDIAPGLGTCADFAIPRELMTG